MGICVPDRNVCGDGADQQTCDTYTCECEPGISGRDCSLRAPDVCHVHASPANGGVCTEIKSEGGRLWAVCDCRNAFGQSGTSVENPDCRYSVTDVCEVGATQSDYAYCYNGGTCLAMIGARSKEPHPGCDCSGTRFAGRHCQFPRENIPVEEEVFVATGKDIIAQFDQESEARKSPVKETSSTRTIIGALTFLGLAVLMYGFVQRQLQSDRRHRAVIAVVHIELEMSCSSDDGEAETPSGFHSAVVGGNQIC
jgi:hypothetical protein